MCLPFIIGQFYDNDTIGCVGGVLTILGYVLLMVYCMLNSLS